MTKQEIEKAIEKGESVWVALDDKVERLVNLEWFTDDVVKSYNMDTGVSHMITRDYFNHLYKTKAEAEHYLHHANVSRIEHLPFLTWEDIENYISNMKHFGLNRNDRVLARIITKDSIYYFKLCKDFDLFTFQLKQTYIGEDLCEQIRDKFPVSLGEATEANFYQAYDECVRLFKGGGEEV